MGRALKEHLVIISDNYPSERFPSAWAFVEVFATAMAESDLEVSVISPVAWHRAHRYRRAPARAAVSGKPAPTVWRPRHLSLSARTLGVWNTAVLTQRFFERAVARCLLRFSLVPSVFYGHFLYSGGKAAVKLGRQRNAPVFVGVGESVGEDDEILWSIRPFGVPRAIRELSSATGFIAVSALLRRKLEQQLRIAPEAIEVFPNGTDLRLFYPRDRNAMRQKHGLPANAFLVAFTGDCVERKGPLRVLEAIQGLPNTFGLFIGDGPQRPAGPQVAWVGAVPHGLVPELLSAADVFVLPTIREGSCNAIVEALACGLPVVTSIGSFNDELVDGEVAIRIPPLDIQAIRTAVRDLLSRPERRRLMAAAALLRATNFSAQSRVRRIRDWMRLRVTETCGG